MHGFRTTLVLRMTDETTDNDTQELLARADASTRADILRKMETELGAKLDVTVGGTKLTAAQVSAVNSLYVLPLLLLVSLLMLLKI